MFLSNLHTVFQGAPIYIPPNKMSFPHSSVGKESACNAGDLGLIPGLVRSPGEGNGNHSSIFAWKILWTEELGELQSVGSQKS